MSASPEQQEEDRELLDELLIPRDEQLQDTELHKELLNASDVHELDETFRHSSPRASIVIDDPS